ncbi:MAG: AI-2E family transporter [Alistipes sp.]|nr:AI-2E family transporter [Alistipes sp.]
MVEKKKYIRIGIVAFAVFLIIYYWSEMSGVLALGVGAAMPLLVGVIMAYIINILMCFYEKIYFKNSRKAWVGKTRRGVCIILSLVTVVTILAAVLGIVVPEFASGIELLIKEVPAVLNKAYLWVINNEEIKPFLDPTAYNTQIDWQKMIKDVIDVIISGAGGVMNSAFSIASSLFSFAAQALIGFIFAMYLLFNKEKVLGQFDKLFKVYMKESFRKKMEYFFTVANDTFKSYIVGQCTEAVILGALCAVGMLILQFPYAGMTGAVIGVTALIPVAGAYIGAGVGAFMICTVSPLKAVLFLVYIVVLQQIEGNLIYPKVVGTSIGLPGMWVLAAVTVGGGILGIPGMLFGVPLAATLYKLLRADVNSKLRNTAAENVAE